ncbi:MAG: hypothetical protein D6816_12340 [Bacteroidetes bacterium]|nr:MAG: hypothetical protein D6816_12340 [Bacteroidota bacterium]
MDQIELSNHSFLIRIWREEGARPAWRGHITHIPSGERRYFEELSTISLFVLPYLEEMGVLPGMYWRLKIWFQEKLQTRKVEKRD